MLQTPSRLSIVLTPDRQIEEAEEQNHPQGRPGSFLNRLISHGNKKTEDQLLAEQSAAQKGATGASATNTATETGSKY